MIRTIEDWELKYYKLIINKRFSFFKWGISFNFQIINKQLDREWKKIIDRTITQTATTSSVTDSRYSSL